MMEVNNLNAFLSAIWRSEWVLPTLSEKSKLPPSQNHSCNIWWIPITANHSSQSQLLHWHCIHSRSNMKMCSVVKRVGVAGCEARVNIKHSLDDICKRCRDRIFSNTTWTIKRDFSKLNAKYAAYWIVYKPVRSMGMWRREIWYQNLHIESGEDVT